MNEKGISLVQLRQRKTRQTAAQSASMQVSQLLKSPTHSTVVTWLPARKVCLSLSTFRRTVVMMPTTNVW